MNIIDENLSFGTLTKRKSTSQIILHHAAMNGSIFDIHRVHKNKGWSGIGYHFFVRKDGSIYRGRPIWAIGAHASGSNYNSIGICAEGNFDNEKMNDMQKMALIQIINNLMKTYHISILKRHRDVSKTACPGKNYPFEEIKVSVNKKIDRNNISYDRDPMYKEGTQRGNPEEKQEDESIKRELVRAGQIHANNFVHAGLLLDGIYGEKTKQAGIKAIQAAINMDYRKMIAVDGLWGKNSQAALGYHYVKKGEKQYLVTAVQINMLQKGYACTVQNPGLFDENLECVIKKYQQDYQLTVDGIVGYNTFMTMIHNTLG